jgi:nitrogen PTS system EIIA component
METTNDAPAVSAALDSADGRAMNPLGELMSLEDIRLDVEVADSHALLEHVAALLAAKHGVSAAAILDSLSARERLGSTGVGHGVAIPHARMPECYDAASVIVRTRSAIAFDAPDHKPVSVFLGLIVPARATDQHLHLLATAAGLFGDRVVREQLRTCDSPAALLALVQRWSDPVGA